MKERLREINRSLHSLDEAHRLGRISRDDYRARRRHLLETLCDGGGITARHTMDAATVPRASVVRTTTPAPAQHRQDEAVAAMFPWWSRLLWWRHRR